MNAPRMNGSRILLIISGGIAAYKCLELIRALRERGASVRIVMTKAAAHFVTPLSLGALTNDKVYSDLFDLNDEREIGHIRLSREADLIVVAPATANLLAKMAGGHGDDLASCVLLAADKPVLVAPAMNPKMWAHRATARNVELLKGDGIAFVGPAHGEMAESGEAGEGRLADLPSLLTAIDQQLQRQHTPASAAGSAAGPASGNLLHGKHIVITAGPTHEPIDPVRYIANRSSGKQGYAIARAAAQAGANVTLIAGPTNLPDPAGVAIHHVETARDMLQSVRAALPADIAIFTAAVADWRVEGQAGEKIKKDKSSGANVPSLRLVENPDILRTIATAKKQRPQLVIGFAAETQSDRLIEFAQAKLTQKGCDWIVANDVSVDATRSGDTATAGVMGGVMGGDENTVHIVTRGGVEDWPKLSKQDVAQRLIARISAHVSSPPVPKRKVGAS